MAMYKVTGGGGGEGGLRKKGPNDISEPAVKAI